MFTLLLILSLCSTAVFALKPNEEHRLLKHLITNYPCSTVRPVANHTQKINVEFGATLVSVADWDKDDSVLKVNVWYIMKWYDAYLKWKPSAFGNIKAVRIPVGKIWSPDITMYTSPDETSDEDGDELAVVNHKGAVIYVPRVKNEVQCKQTCGGKKGPTTVKCTFIYGSWVYSSREVDILFMDGKTGFDLSLFDKTGKWKTLKTSGTKKNMKYDCCPERYPRFEYVLEFQIPK